MTLKKNITEFGSDVIEIAKLFAKDLKIEPKARAPGIRSMFKDSMKKDKTNFKGMFDSFKEDIDAIKNKRFTEKTERKERNEQAPPPTKTDTKPRAYYLDRLGLTPEATQEQIKAAWREAALKYHPDRNKSSWASQRFIELQDAWEHLK